MDGDRKILAFGGMDERFVTAPGVATRIENLHHDPEGFWRDAPGTLSVQEFTPGSGAISSMIWFAPRLNQRWLVYELAYTDDTALIQWLDFRTGGHTLIATRRRQATTDLGTLFLQNAGWLYMISPVDAPTRWNGEWTSPVGFAGPAAPPFVAGYDQGYTSMDRAGAEMAAPTIRHQTQQRGVGPYPDTADEFWRYGYAVTWINELGQESPPSPMQFASGQNTAVVGVGKRMVRIHVPRPPAHVRGVRLYRTRNLIDVSDPGAQATLYFLDEFAMAGEFDYLDLASDNELGAQFDPDSVGAVPVGPTAAAFWGGLLWLGGSVVDPTRLHYSAPLAPEQFPAINFLEVGSSATGPIVALFPIQRALVVLKTGGVYVVKGDAASGFSVEVLTEEVGCAAPRAVTYVKDQGLFFLAAEGPHLVVGSLNDEQVTKVVPVGGIRRTWRRYIGNLLQACVVHQPEFNEVWFQVPQGGDQRPTLGLVYHTDLQQWSLRTDYQISCFARGLGRVWLGSWEDTANGGIHILSYAQASHFGTSNRSYYGLYLTNDEADLIHHVDIHGLALGSDALLTVATQTDRSATAVQTDTGKAQLQPRRDLALWGVDTWSSTETWVDQAPARFRVSVHKVVARELGLSIQASRMRLAGVTLQTTPGIKPPPERQP